MTSINIFFEFNSSFKWFEFIIQVFQLKNYYINHKLTETHHNALNLNFQLHISHNINNFINSFSWMRLHKDHNSGFHYIFLKE